MKPKFSSFFKNVVVELDKEMYGPDNHLTEWHRSPSSEETDGFTVSAIHTSFLPFPLFSSHVPLCLNISPLGDSSWRGDSQMHYSASVKPPGESSHTHVAVANHRVSPPLPHPSPSLPPLAYAVQADQQASSSPGHPHCHQTRHYQCSVAVHQGTQWRECQREFPAM